MWPSQSSATHARRSGETTTINEKDGALDDVAGDANETGDSNNERRAENAKSTFAAKESSDDDEDERLEQLSAARRTLTTITTSQSAARTFSPVARLEDVEDVYLHANTMNTFEVVLRKNARGLGFSITGGRDATCRQGTDAVVQLISVKKVFLSEPAAYAGLREGDILLEANDIKMVGLTNLVCNLAIM